MSRVSFASDNHSGVHPQILQAMVEANSGYSASYEQDPYSQKLKALLRKDFKAIDSALVFNGTAANVICMQMALETYESCLCADVSHLNLDECGAPEKIAGVKLIPIPAEHGKLKVEQLSAHLIRRGDQHHSQVKMVSITQPTEYGTVYSSTELQALRDFCDQEGLYLHIDGARLSNAAVTLKSSMAEIARFADLLSLGGAKKGLMLGELVIIRNPGLQKKLKFIRKQSLQLPSKTRFLAAGFLRFFEEDLWQEMATTENTHATYLYQNLQDIPQIQVTQPVQANSVFCTMPKSWIKPLREQFFFYVWNEHSYEVRLMMSHSTTTAQIDAFIQEIHSLAQGHTTQEL
jgi:threonine aldolase